MLDRRAPLDRAAHTGTVGIAPAAACARLVLRCRARVTAATIPLLPDAIGGSVILDGRIALKLGPDEWLVLSPLAGEPALTAYLAAELTGVPHALVDIGHRQAAIRVTGPRAADTLSSGCPLDLSRDAFPVGRCTRTLLSKAEIVLWRRAADAFHVEIGRSLAAYAWDFLAEAAREFLP